MYIKRFSLLIFFVFFFFLIPSKVSAATYYVAGDTGLDTNNGSITTPWKTIQKAANTMIAGDTVNVKGGIVYNEAYSSEFGIYTINSGSLNNLISYRAWDGTGNPVITSTSAQAIFYSPNDDYISIEDFVFKVTVNNQSAMVFATVNDNVVFKNNLIFTIESVSGAIGIFHGGQGHSVKIYNNSVSGLFAYGIKLTTFGPGAGWTCDSGGDYFIKNNIVTQSTVGIRIASPANLHFSNCYDQDYNLFDNVTNFEVSSSGSHDITSDPLFVTPSLSNFRLQRLSPAINTGTDLTASGVTTDILGVPRPQGSGFDIGAYEYYDIPVTVTGSYPNFTGTASTIDTGNISSIQYSVDGGSWQTSGVNGTTTFSIVIPQELYIPDGNHTLRVRATDSYTNTTDESLYATTTFNKDTVVKTTSVNNTCTAVKPEGTPVITSITNLTPSSVKLLFSDSWTHTVDSYFVEYGTKPNVYQYSTQSIGGKGTKETVISNLTPNKTYYFRIRNGNNCNVGNWSLPVSIKNENSKVKTNETTTLRQDNAGQAKTKLENQTPNPTPTPVVSINKKTNILQTIINWLTNAFKKLL